MSMTSGICSTHEMEDPSAACPWAPGIRVVGQDLPTPKVTNDIMSRLRSNDRRCSWSPRPRHQVVESFPEGAAAPSHTVTLRSLADLQEGRTVGFIPCSSTGQTTLNAGDSESPGQGHFFFPVIAHRKVVLASQAQREGTQGLVVHRRHEAEPPTLVLHIACHRGPSCA